MSALCQKRTLDAAKVMSALPRKWTSDGALGMSAKGQADIRGVCPFVCIHTLPFIQQRRAWVAGGGFEYAIDRHWSANIEYNYIDLGTKSYNLGNIAPTILEIDPRFHIVKLGLNYKLDDAAPNDTFVPTAPESNNWNVHAQTTFIQQGYPGFRSPYEGAKSLPGVGLGRETWTVTAFLGWRLWEGGEFYFNPELAQGFGIGSTLGLAGFSNGEAPEGRRPVSQDSCAALFSPTNLWVWRRAGRRRRRSQSTAG